MLRELFICMLGFVCGCFGALGIAARVTQKEQSISFFSHPIDCEGGVVSAYYEDGVVCSCNNGYGTKEALEEATRRLNTEPVETK